MILEVATKIRLIRDYNCFIMGQFWGLAFLENPAFLVRTLSTCKWQHWAQIFICVLTIIELPGLKLAVLRAGTSLHALA